MRTPSHGLRVFSILLISLLACSCHHFSSVFAQSTAASEVTQPSIRTIIPTTQPGAVPAVQAIPVPISDSTPIPVPQLIPRPQDRIIARNVAIILQKSHLEHPRIDDAVSEKAFRLFFKALDPLKMYFYQQDIDEFAAYENAFDDIVKSGDLSVPFSIYNRFLLRVNERMDTVMKLLDEPHDFTVDEEMIRDKELMSYPKSPEEASDRWRKRIKYEILVLKGEARDKAKEREKEAAEKAAGQSSEEPEKRAKKTTSRDDEDPIKRLKRRYTGFRKRMLLPSRGADGKTTLNNDDVIETFLTSIGMALDPHSTYMSPSTFRNFIIQMGLKLEGIGATLSSEDGYTIVKGLVKGGAAKKSGLIDIDDKIIGVGQGKDGQIEDVVDMKLSDVVDRIRGPKGTIVRLDIIPSDGSGRKTIEITREVVKLEDSAAKEEVFEVGKKADGSPYKIGVINLPSFYLDINGTRAGDQNAKSTTNDVRRILRNFVAQNVDAVVLDLQFNGGGSLAEAVKLTGLFIETGNVVQTKEQRPNMMPRITPLDDPDPSVEWTGPLVVVVNKFSASASEIFAGAIKDYKRGIIVGDSRTHGKGSVQQMKELGEELGLYDNESYGALKLTIQGFFLPSGGTPQLKGVTADVVLPSVTDVWEDICEEDLDYPLSFEKIKPASQYPVFPYVSPEIDAALQSASDARAAAVKDFIDLRRDIALYKELKAKKTVTLNEEKYFAELDRLDTDKKEKEKLDKILENEDKIKRDFYLDEVMNITIDYINLLQQQGIGFPKERSKQQRRTFLNDLFGLSSL